MGFSEGLPVLSLTSLLPSVLGTSCGDSVLCYKTNPSLNPVLLSLTPTFPFTLPYHQPLFLGSWHCPAPAHCCLWVCGRILLNFCSGVCRGCLWEVSVKFIWMHSLALGRALLGIQLGSWCWDGNEQVLLCGLVMSAELKCSGILNPGPAGD